jgi:hypothetical protein
MTKPFFIIHEDLETDPFVVDIKFWLRNQVPIFSNNYGSFQFQNGLLYHDGLLHVFDGPTWLQIFQVKLMF